MTPSDAPLPDPLPPITEAPAAVDPPIGVRSADSFGVHSQDTEDTDAIEDIDE